MQGNETASICHQTPFSQKYGKAPNTRTIEATQNIVHTRTPSAIFLPQSCLDRAETNPPWRATPALNRYFLRLPARRRHYPGIPAADDAPHCICYPFDCIPDDRFACGLRLRTGCTSFRFAVDMHANRCSLTCCVHIGSVKLAKKGLTGFASCPPASCLSLDRNGSLCMAFCCRHGPSYFASPLMVRNLGDYFATACRSFLAVF